MEVPVSHTDLSGYTASELEATLSACWILWNMAFRNGGLEHLMNRMSVLSPLLPAFADAPEPGRRPEPPVAAAAARRALWNVVVV